LLATVSLASDLAHDVPAESALRDALVAVKLADLAGWPAGDQSDVYYLALLYHVGCTGAVDAQSRLGAGDDITVRHWLSEIDYTDRPDVMRISLAKLAPHWGPADWAHGMATFMTFRRSVADALANTAEVAAMLSARLGVSAEVTSSLGYAYARWDGKFFRDLPSGPDQSAISRLVHMVHVAQTHHHFGGIEAADAVVRERRGGEFDPDLAALWLSSRDDLRESLAAPSVWDEALAAEPEPHRMVPGSHIDEVVRALAEFVDLKSTYTLGHSTRLATLAGDAGAGAGLGAEDIATLRRAAHVHDLGNLSVPNQVWIKRGPLNASEWSRVRQHTYHTHRILSVCEPLRACADVAGLHHERLDGSGYHRGLPAGAIPLPARILAAAEAYQSRLEDRSWRPGLSTAQAAAELRRDVSSGRLDRRAVDAVLEAAGHPSRRGRAGRSWPASLTDREVDVLRLLARGCTNKQIARHLHISEATVHTHVINLYGKAAVSTRAGATLFALEHDLVDAAAREKID
jgi:DNA-binding CsgD family transcriptional regulator